MSAASRRCSRRAAARWPAAMVLRASARAAAAVRTRPRVPRMPQTGLRLPQAAPAAEVGRAPLARSTAAGRRLAARAAAARAPKRRTAAPVTRRPQRVKSEVGPRCPVWTPWCPRCRRAAMGRSTLRGRMRRSGLRRRRPTGRCARCGERWPCSRSTGARQLLRAVQQQRQRRRRRWRRRSPKRAAGRLRHWPRPCAAWRLRQAALAQRTGSLLFLTLSAPLATRQRLHHLHHPRHPSPVRRPARPRRRRRR
mmetsp:Transcript_13202/g.38929  ORF Transcript_13202/g.38929 Transcript_13202/m.38929 type:complete len:252 (+) Transcript_13202:312-1067(+)